MGLEMLMHELRLARQEKAVADLRMNRALNEVVHHIVEDQLLSTSEAARQTGLSHQEVWEILGMKPELHPDLTIEHST